MFDPLSAALIMGGIKLVHKLQGRSSSSPAPSPAACRWCGNAISGDSITTSCCQSRVCQSCTPEWQQAGGKNCVLCGNTHA